MIKLTLEEALEIITKLRAEADEEIKSKKELEAELKWANIQILELEDDIESLRDTIIDLEGELFRANSDYMREQ